MIPFRKPDFANSLILRIGLLILFALAAFTFSSYHLLGRPTIDRLANAQMQLAAEQIDARVGRLLKTVEVTLRSSQGWGRNGDLDHSQLLRFNEFFFPILANHGEITSVIFAHESGREILLLLTDDGHWINRITDPQLWGKQTYWITWSAQRKIEKVEMRVIDYDARNRPWFKGAMALPDNNAIAWTNPYIFFTTREAGITAAMQWQGHDGSRYVIAHDVRLRDIGEYTTHLSLGTQGKAALFTDEGKLLAPPNDPRFTDKASINEVLLKTADEIGMPDLANGYATWKARGQTPGRLGSFNMPDTLWLSLFRPMRVGNQQIWIGVFAPETDFNPSTRQDFVLLGMISLFILALGMIVAIRMARRFGQPLQALAEESERIGRQELSQPVITDAPWREVTQLAAALEGMRQHLQLSQKALQDINVDLEQTVARRTHALHESQEILQKREAIFRAIFDNAAVGIISLNPQQQATLANPAYAMFIDRPAEKLLGKDISDLLPATEQDRLHAMVDRAIDNLGKSQRSEFEFIATSGEVRWGDVQIAAIRQVSGELDSLLVTVLDITDRRQIETELIRQFAFLQALLDTIPNPIFYKGAHTRFLGCNTAYEKFFGIERADFIGKRVLDLEFIPEEARLAYQAEDEAVIAECGRISREVSMVGADGQSHDTLYSVTGFHTTEGELGGLIGVIVDISPLKKAERIAEQARAAAEEAAAAKADFLANMSHEIRTPMNAIIGMTHLALQTDLSARQKNYLSKVDNAAKGLLGIINDILDLSKIEAGKMLVEQTRFRLDDCLQNLADVCLLKASEHGLELLFDIAPEVPDHLVGDPLRLNQVLLNLVGNAIKFTEQGEITVAVGVAASSETSIDLHFEIRDTGIGMSEEQQKQLFTAFSQADSSTTRKYGGTGLGLSICKRIVEMMGGKIGVSSAPGIGSNFHFTLRFGVAAEMDTDTKRLGLPDQLKTLIIEDSPGARQIFRQLLLGFGLPCHAVASGADGVAEMLRANAAGQAYQLLIIDWKMPGMDGIETLRQLEQANALAGRPKIIMTTAFDQDELRSKLGTTPFDAILPKPVTPSTLFDCIVEALHAELPRPTRVNLSPPPGKQSFSGQRVLLVEDNEVNRELAEEMLILVGLNVETAENGVQALEAVRNSSYDLVLMDCQMPVMDGYEATRAIRGDHRYDTLPIIAMTANALPADRERCLATGMNDHIAKPIDVSQLHETLAHWLKPAGTKMPDSPADAIADVKVGNILDEKAALSRLGGNRDLFNRLLVRFHENQGDVVSRLQRALEIGDTAQMALDAHTLRGLAGNIGADHIAVLAGQIEEKAKAGTPDDQADFSGLIHDLAIALQPIFESIIRPGPASEKQGSTLPNPAVCQAALANLESLLEHADAAAVRQFRDMAGWFGQRANPELFEKLGKSIEHYEFDNALEILHKLVDGVSWQ